MRFGFLSEGYVSGSLEPRLRERLLKRLEITLFRVSGDNGFGDFVAGFNGKDRKFVVA